MKTGDELVALLGKASSDPDVEDALAQLAIRWPPELDEPSAEGEEPDWYCWRPSSPLGFEFGFQDEAHLRALDPSLRGRSPLVLSQLYFYGEHPGVKPFAGQLPFGLTLADSRPVIRGKLARVGAPRSHRRDVWDPEPHRIVVAPAESRDVLGSIVVKLRLSDWPPLDEPPRPLPAIAEIIAMFGQPWHSPDMRRVFFPLGLSTCGPDIARHRYADLRLRRGLELYYFRDRARGNDNPLRNKGAVFSAVKFYRSRYTDARGWAGELPLGLTFDDAYPTVVAKLGRPPDAGEDGNLDGYAVWHQPEYTLHLLYDNVDNILSCISLFRPGSWPVGGLW